MYTFVHTLVQISVKVSILSRECEQAGKSLQEWTMCTTLCELLCTLSHFCTHLYKFMLFILSLHLSFCTLMCTHWRTYLYTMCTYLYAFLLSFTDFSKSIHNYRCIHICVQMFKAVHIVYNYSTPPPLKQPTSILRLLNNSKNRYCNKFKILSLCFSFFVQLWFNYDFYEFINSFCIFERVFLLSRKKLKFIYLKRILIFDILLQLMFVGLV